MKVLQFVVFPILLMLEMLSLASMLILELLLSPIKLISVPLFQKIDSIIWQWGIHLCYIPCFLSGGLYYTYYGDYVDNGGIKLENNLILSNHVSSADWIINLFVVLKSGGCGKLRFLMKSTHKIVPFIGWIAIIHDCIFLKRDLKKDKEIIEKKMKYYNKNKTPVWTIMYPEGTFPTPACKWVLEKSQEFSKKMGYLVKEYVLEPKTKGFALILENAGNTYKYVTDLTMALGKPYSVKITETFPPLMSDLVKFDPPKEFHIHTRSFKVEDIPQGFEEREKWLRERYDEKEKLLEYFHKNGKFPGKSTERAQPTEKFLLILNFLVTGSVWVYLGKMVYNVYPSLVYGFFAFCVFSAMFIIGYDGLHQAKKYKGSELEKKLS